MHAFISKEESPTRKIQEIRQKRPPITIGSAVFPPPLMTGGKV